MRKRIRLGFNIDHVATVRNARGDDYPSPLRAAIIAQNSVAILRIGIISTNEITSLEKK